MIILNLVLTIAIIPFLIVFKTIDLIFSFIVGKFLFESLTLSLAKYTYYLWKGNNENIGN